MCIPIIQDFNLYYCAFSTKGILFPDPRFKDYVLTLVYYVLISNF